MVSAPGRGQGFGYRWSRPDEAAGGLPPVEIGGMSFADNSYIFDKVISKVPEDALEKPINYEEKIPNGFQEWVIAFYGVCNWDCRFSALPVRAFYR